MSLEKLSTSTLMFNKNKNMNNNFERFAIINAEIEALKTEKDEIKVEIMADMLSKGESKEDTAVGKFSITQLKTWTYTPKVDELNEEFKAQKATEESTGEATFVENPSLRFTKNNL